jgi:superfamily I DNA and/or RNA helicase
VLLSGAEWVDKDTGAQLLKPEHILIVAPYNSQVALLTTRLGHRGIRIGTVDKFQGQEAPIVIYSMATSTLEDAPRGMEFLCSLNRLNVATSRAQRACVLVASPRLFAPECKTPRQMRRARTPFAVM